MTCVIEFFKGRGFFRSLPFYFFPCLLLYGCITEYKPKDIDEVEGILVVEGIITDGTSVITLSRSKELSYEDDLWNLSPYQVTDAKVWIECDDGQQWASASSSGGQYTIETGALYPERQYRLKIEFEEHEYHSEFACPMVSPEIDSVFWIKKAERQPVMIYVDTHAPDSAVQYVRWTFQEDLEYTSFRYLEKILNLDGSLYQKARPFYCWKQENSNELLLSSSEKTGFGKITSQITEIVPSDDRLAILYRIEVNQNAIRKRSFDYFENMKRNAEKTGSLFAHVPAELKGNIICTTDPARPAIGYVDVSTTTRKRLYISSFDSDVYEPVPKIRVECSMTPFNYNRLSTEDKELYVLYWWSMPFPTPVPIPIGYSHISCVDCTLWGGSTEKPADWPNEHFNDHLD